METMAPTLVVTRVVIGLAVALQLCQLLFLPVPSSFATVSLLASPRGQVREGALKGWRLVLLALCAVGALLGALIPLLFALHPGALPRLGPLFLPTWASCLAGTALVTLGSAMTLSAVLTLRQKGRFDTSGESEVLITSGIFRLLRHPIGAGLGLIYLGFWLLVPALGVLAGFVLYTINVRFRSAYEEAELHRRFGARYQAYADRVGPLLPRRRRSRTTEAI